MKRNNGRIVTKFSDDIFFKNLASEWQSPSEVSKKIECSLSTAQKTLRRLFQEEKIDGKKMIDRWIYKLK